MKPQYTIIITLLSVLWLTVGQGLISPAQAEPVSKIIGQVTDASTGEPIAGVNIVVLDSELGAATDNKGIFSIDNISPGTYRLQFSYVGYSQIIRTDVVVISVRPTELLEQLTPSAVEGEVVTIQAGLFRRELKAPTSTVSLAREEIRRFPGGFEDVVRTVSTLPGVAVVSDGGRNDLLVRGGGPSENLYIINEMEVPNINHFGSQGSSSGSLSFVNLDFVDRVDFSTGGFGAAYGDKLSSVLGLNLRPARSDRWGGKATISATQFGLNIEGPLSGNGGMVFSARKSYLDLIFRAAGLAFIPVYTDFNMALNYDLTPRDKLFVIGLMAIDKVERDQSSSKNRVQNAGIMDNTQNQAIGGISYRHIGRSSLTNLSVNLNTNHFLFSQVDSGLVEYFKSDAWENELVLKGSTKLSLSSEDDLLVGLTHKNSWTETNTSFADTIYNSSGRKVPRSLIGLPATLSSDDTKAKSGAYVSWERKLSERWSGTIGLRGDYYGYIDEPFYPSARTSLTYQATPRTQIKGSFGRYYQSPAYVWVANPLNKGLKALRNDMGVLGVTYLVREDINMTGEVYYKQYADLPTGATPGTDYIVLTNSGVGYGGREDNFGSFGFIPLTSKGKGYAYGVEISAKKKYAPPSNHYAQAALSIGRSRYTAANGVEYPGQFDQTVIFSASGGFKPNPRWEYTTKFRIWTGAPYTPIYRPAENNGNLQKLPDEYLSKRLSVGHSLDVRVERRFNWERLTLITFIDIQNLYNNKIELRPTYDFWDDTISNSSAIAILPSIGISAEF